MNSIDLLRSKRESGYASGSPQGNFPHPGGSEGRTLELTEEEKQACLAAYPKGGPAILKVNGALSPEGAFDVQSLTPEPSGAPEAEPPMGQAPSQISPG